MEGYGKGREKGEGPNNFSHPHFRFSRQTCLSCKAVSQSFDELIYNSVKLLTDKLMVVID